jgi:pimeloyl-ACP methyl ester carboxylesterase/DNA-binding winged helix-turn-helix (wHTH) protein
MIYRFGSSELDPDRHRLSTDGAEIHTEPQVFALLAQLLARAPDLVSYDDLMAEVWKGRIVSDATVAARISAARAAVGDDGKAQGIIRTVPRCGVQMAVAVTQVGQGADAPLAAPETIGAPMQQTIRYTKSRDGTAIAWAEIGDGPPLLRGGHWLSHLEYDWQSPVWRPLLERLSRGRRLIRYDPRGTGLSDRNLGAATLPEFVDDMEAVADAAGLDRFPIYGISQSVPIALSFAARRPGRVSRLILLNGLVRGSTARGDKATTDTMVAMIKSGWGVAGSPFMRAVATLFMPRATPEELESQVQMQAVSATPETAAEIRRIVGDIDVSDILHKVRAPALVMHSAGDAIQSPEQSKLIARSLADVEFSLCDSPNHMVVPSDPIWGPCMDAFDRFLADDRRA